jgi:recombination protein RecR
MKAYPVSLERLSEQFAKLPGIGTKTARRLAFFVLGMSDADAEAFASAILEARRTVHTCPVCQNLTDQETCPICADGTRDGSVICVVADPKDVIAMEKAREYRGRYHVLHGVISPLGNVGPEDLKIRELLQRVADEDIREVIMATNPDTEGDATAMYISRLLRPFGVKVTRLGFGVPVGSNLEYADDATMLKGLEGRREM